MNKINKNKYLDLNGLKKYDELVKSYIALSNESLAKASDVHALQKDVAELKSIDHNAYISADIKLEESIKEYTDSKLDLKQDVITDLNEIRSGAALGSTALQEVPSEFITEIELEDKKYVNEIQVEKLIDNAVVMVSDSDIDNIFN